LEEKFEALMKQNAKKEAQNEYLRKQLHAFMRQRRKATRLHEALLPPLILSGLNKKERTTNLRDPLLKMKPLDVQGVEDGDQPLSLRLISRSLKANWTQMTFWSGCKP